MSLFDRERRVHVHQGESVGSHEQRPVEHHCASPVQLAQVHASRRVISNELDVFLVRKRLVAVSVRVDPDARVVLVEARRFGERQTGDEQGKRHENLATNGQWIA